MFLLKKYTENVIASGAKQSRVRVIEGLFKEITLSSFEF